MYKDSIDNDIESTVTKLIEKLNIIKNIKSRKERSTVKYGEIEQRKLIYPPLAIREELGNIKIEDFDVMGIQLKDFISNMVPKYN